MYFVQKKKQVFAFFYVEHRRCDIVKKQYKIQLFNTQGCISCGILVSGIRARGISSEHMENMENIEMFSCSPT